MKIFYLLVLLWLPFSCYADTDLNVSMLSEQIKNATELGEIEVDGVGDVKLIVHKKGSQIIVHAQNREGEVIGKAESVIGIKETPIYVMTPVGLKKITIKWVSKKH